MNPRQTKRSMCNAHGIRVYPVLQYGKYVLEVEFNKTPEFDRRYIRKNSKGELMLKRGTEKFETDKKYNKLWAQRIEEMYEELYDKKVKPKLEKSLIQ